MQGTEQRTKHSSSTNVASVVPFRLRSYRFIRKCLLGFIVVSIINFFFSNLFYTPKMYEIISENDRIQTKYTLLQERIATAQRTVDEIRHRDNFVYRPLFSTDSIDMPQVWQAYPESKYSHLQGDEYSDAMISAWQGLDALARELYLSSISFDELQRLGESKEELSMAIPAIWPIDRLRFVGRHIGAFNMRRFHPVLKRIRPHLGIDIGGKRGDPIFATGDATVKRIGYERRGYGHYIVLDHEFGYETRYAHLQKVLVKKGERVVRGQLIAEMGNTGLSQAPHLHYEVIHKGRHVNPIHYFDRNMSAESYDSLMQVMMQDTNFEKLQ